MPKKKQDADDTYEFTAEEAMDPAQLKALAKKLSSSKGKDTLIKLLKVCFERARRHASPGASGDRGGR